MPKPPNHSSYADQIVGDVFSSLATRIPTFEGEVFPLHVGDTWREPAVGCRMEDLRVDEHPGMHRYAPPTGLPSLVEALVEHRREALGIDLGPENLLVAAGATAGLGAVFGSILEPGDEVLILSPHWPLIAGIVPSFRGRAVEVPFLGRVSSASDAVEAVGEHLSERTIALYFSFPNNPTGATVPQSWIDALVDWACRHDLWVVSDEVYEDYCFDGEPPRALPLAPERTFAVHSFSKAYGMAGNRVGAIFGPAEVLPQLHKLSTHTAYSTPTASQIAALRVLTTGAGEQWVAESRRLYRELGAFAAKRLGVEEPDGGTFLFLDVAPALDDRGLVGFLEDCADRGVFLAPGPSFGSYPTHVRICFTATAPEIIHRGVEALRKLLVERGATKRLD